MTLGQADFFVDYEIYGSRNLPNEFYIANKSLKDWKNIGKYKYVSL